MPFVYVHGVNTRADLEFEREQKAMHAFLRAIVAPAGDIDSDQKVFVPYWGDEGIRFWKGLAVVPDGKGSETFGGANELPPSLGLAIAEDKIPAEAVVATALKQKPDLTVDLLFDAAASGTTSEKDFEDLARAYKAARDLLEQQTDNAWLADADLKYLADTVYTRVRPPKTDEAFGSTGLWSRLEEGAKRLALKVPDAVSQGLVTGVRKPLTTKIGTFIGDAFQYLAERGDGAKPGAIVSIVLKELVEASRVAKEKDEQLVVICHSFGGEIVYDILTHYAVDLDVDVLVTVGSQVGLFEEMSLLWTSPRRVRPQSVVGDEAISAPARVKRWINIFDTNDVLGFAIAPVFTATPPHTLQDFKYDSGFPVTGAHSGYFKWPSFYRRLAHRIGEKA